MNSRIFIFELKGESVLGFDTGLNAQAFAQAKMAQFITAPGTIVYPDGRVEEWRPGGVTETGFGAADGSKAAETMIVWGPPFPGERLAGIVNESPWQDEALDALRFWLKARIAIEDKAGNEPPYPGPAGAFIVLQKQGGYPEGTVFFPPFRLLKRTLEAEGAASVIDAERWVHPDLQGSGALSFSAASMLYRVFCGSAPFTRNEPDVLRQDMREGVFVPPNLAAPGLDPEMSGVISRALAGREEKPRPTPDFIGDFIGPAHTKPVSSWIKPLDEEAAAKIRAEQEQYSRKKSLSVKTRRFVIRNTAIIAACVIAVVVLALFIRSMVKHEAELPTTKGMSPVEVAAAYYGAFGALDHMLMDACVTGKAGKGDVEMVVNLFVISKMRQAYETGGNNFMSAQDWVEAGRPVTDKTVFGVTDLNIQSFSEDESHGTANLEADYILWMPASFFKEEDETPPAKDASGTQENAPSLPGALATKDRLGLVLHKGAWRIAEIDRESSRMEQ